MRAVRAGRCLAGTRQHPHAASARMRGLAWDARRKVEDASEPLGGRTQVVGAANLLRRTEIGLMQRLANAPDSERGDATSRRRQPPAL